MSRTHFKFKNYIKFCKNTNLNAESGEEEIIWGIGFWAIRGFACGTWKIRKWNL